MPLVEGLSSIYILTLSEVTLRYSSVIPLPGFIPLTEKPPLGPFTVSCSTYILTLSGVTLKYSSEIPLPGLIPPMANPPLGPLTVSPST